MPVMNGCEATSIIKQKTSIPVIAQTAYEKHVDIETIEKAGFDDFILKPIDYKELLLTIESYL